MPGGLHQESIGWYRSEIGEGIYMAKIQKKQPPIHLLIVDTNILWCADKAPPVSPVFDDFLKKHESLIKLELVIPDVVKGELLYQQTQSALKALDKVITNVSHISKVTAQKHNTRLESDKIVKQVKDKFDKWIKAKSAIVAPIPYTQIDWKRLCYDAVWRNPPFGEDPDNRDYEKGYRDALVLETVYDIATREARSVNIIFVCDDELLRSAAKKRLSANVHFFCYETLNELSSYIKLTNEKLTNEFIKSILGRASNKFYSNADESCLYHREKLFDRIRSEFKSKFDNPAESDKSAIGLMQLLSTPAMKWMASSEGMFYLSGTEFLKIEGERKYYWKSGLTFVRFYTAEFDSANAITFPVSSSISNRKVLLLPFKIYWKANVKADGRFHDVALERIELENNVYREPTDQELLKYGYKREEL